MYSPTLHRANGTLVWVAVNCKKSSYLVFVARTFENAFSLSWNHSFSLESLCYFSRIRLTHKCVCAIQQCLKQLWFIQLIDKPSIKYIQGMMVLQLTRSFIPPTIRSVLRQHVKEGEMFTICRSSAFFLLLHLKQGDKSTKSKGELLEVKEEDTTLDETRNPIVVYISEFRWRR